MAVERSNKFYVHLDNILLTLTRANVVLNTHIQKLVLSIVLRAKTVMLYCQINLVVTYPRVCQVSFLMYIFLSVQGVCQEVFLVQPTVQLVIYVMLENTQQLATDASSVQWASTQPRLVRHLASTAG